MEKVINKSNWINNLFCVFFFKLIYKKLKERAIFKLLQSSDFCMHLRISSPLPPTNVSTVLPTSLEYPSKYVHNGVVLGHFVALKLPFQLPQKRSIRLCLLAAKSFNWRFYIHSYLLSLHRFCLFLLRCFSDT